MFLGCELGHGRSWHGPAWHGAARRGKVFYLEKALSKNYITWLFVVAFLLAALAYALTGDYVNAGAFFTAALAQLGIKLSPWEQPKQ